MKIVKAKIVGKLYTPPSNEPYREPRLVIGCIFHYYDEGGFDQWVNSMFGCDAEEEFYTILDDDCEVELDIEEVEIPDEYYMYNDYKRACFNRDKGGNPYQYPKWTTLKD